jgi:hypothetical protein
VDQVDQVLKIALLDKKVKKPIDLSITEVKDLSKV